MKDKFDLLTAKISEIVIVIIVWATLVNFTSRDLRNKSLLQKFTLFCLDLLYAGFFGVIGFLLAREYGIGLNGSAAISGIFAYEGAKILIKVEEVIVSAIPNFKNLKK